MNRARAQIRKLYLLDGVGSIMIAGASWVALLAARGYSTVEIGFIESIFHVASMIFEVPSGALADVFGRKKIMVASSVMSIISSIIMVLSDSFATISIAMITSALSYNLASGTREALAYDSLKEAGIEKEYDKFASTDMVIYEITSSAATLLTGFALMIGYKKAYILDVLVGIFALIIACSLMEVKMKIHNESSIKKRFKEVAANSIEFIRENSRARLIIVFNALIGAVDILILFFLQAKLPEMGLSKMLLGPALFGMGLGAAVGAKAIDHFPNVRYRNICIFSMVGVVLAFSSVFTHNVCAMIIGGFIGAFADDFLEVRTDIVLNNMIPSNQRATLMSINAFTFSVVMIIMSPIFGWLFS
ncbi:MAG: MFS transporter [Pseudobutyrivibrio sp.]|nr:MFS transporter [Pseudobutyrivibrio sp.]